MKALILKPSLNFTKGRLSEISLGKDTLTDLQEAVGGYVECVYELEKYGITMWCNDEGKLKGLPLSVWIYDRQDVVAGNIVFTGTDEEKETVALTDEQVEVVKKFVANNTFTYEDWLKLIFHK